VNQADADGLPKFPDHRFHWPCCWQGWGFGTILGVLCGAQAEYGRRFSVMGSCHGRLFPSRPSMTARILDS